MVSGPREQLRAAQPQPHLASAAARCSRSCPSAGAPAIVYKIFRNIIIYPRYFPIYIKSGRKITVFLQGIVSSKYVSSINQLTISDSNFSMSDRVLHGLLRSKKVIES